MSTAPPPYDPFAAPPPGPGTPLQADPYAAPPRAGWVPPQGGAGVPPGAGWSPPRSTTDGWAVAALVLGVLGAVPLALACGVAALVRSARAAERGDRRGGRGLAVAGIALAAAWALAAGVGLVALAVEADERAGRAEAHAAAAAAAAAVTPGSAGSAGSAESARSAESTPTFLGAPVLPLRVLDGRAEGDCVVPGTTGLSPVVLTDCEDEHYGEVYEGGALDDGPWPGADVVSWGAEDLCYQRFEDYVGSGLAEAPYDMRVFAPDAAEWAAGTRSARCLVLPYEDDALVGSVAGTQG